MSDLYQSIATSPIGRTLLKTVNLPLPVVLERYRQEQTSFTSGNVLVGVSEGGRCAQFIEATLAGSDAQVFTSSTFANQQNPTSNPTPLKSLVFDATGLKNSTDLNQLYSFFHPVIKQMRTNGRIVVIGIPPEKAESPQQSIAMRALEGFTRAIGKEVKKGCTSQLIYVTPGAENQLPSALRFALSPKSAYVSAQIIRIAGGLEIAKDFNWIKPLDNKIALVTGASSGIGEAIAEVLARDGAKVLGLDVPIAVEALNKVMGRIGGKSLLIDISADDAAQIITDTLMQDFGGVDIVVHNAGITRDKTLGNMPDHYWKSVIDINLCAAERINAQLIKKQVLNQNGRVICVSSMSGIAGNFGQTNYATSKAGVIGLVQAYAPVYAELGITINAVAPGFIETQMTDAMPFTIREAGRRLNSMSQGGQPQDVAEAIAFFASPASSGITGNIMRVCGQSLIGA